MGRSFGPESPITGFHANVITNRNGYINNADPQHRHSAPTVVGLACDASVSVGDFVYVDGNDHVAKVTNNTNSEVVGVVVIKPSATECSVVTSGRADVFTGLTAGTRYFINTDGTLTNPSPATNFVMSVGIAISTTSLIVNIQIPMGRAS